jgi:uncharacterized delta-60 repeat protein
MKQRSIDIKAYLLEALEPRWLCSAGQLDPTFGNGGVVVGPLGDYSGNAERVVAEPNGDLLIAGDDASGGSVVQSDVAVLRCDASGHLDISFGNGGIEVIPESSYVEDLALQPDGKALVLYRNDASDISTVNLIRLTTGGQPDGSFNGGQAVTTALQPYYTPRLAIQSDGELIISGATDSGAALVRYGADGTIDSTFGTAGVLTTNSFARFGAVAVATNGNIYAFGDHSLSGDKQTTVGVACFDSRGSPVDNFGTDGVSSVNLSLGASGDAVSLDIVVQSDGKLLGLVDAFSGLDNDPDGYTRLVRFDTSGRPDPTFGDDGVVKTVFAYSGGNDNIALDGSGRIVLCGSITESQDPNFYTARYDSDGTLDSSFGSNGVATTAIGSASQYNVPTNVAIQRDEKIVVVGLKDGFDGSLVIARYTGDSNQNNSDLTFPTATLTSIDQPLAGSDHLDIIVDYSDNVSIDASTIGTGDITVNGPNGFEATPTLVSSNLTNGATVSATYRLSAPNGSFSNSANGTYTIYLIAGSVADTASPANVIAGVDNFGSFSVSLPVDTTPPTANVPTAPVAANDAPNLDITVDFSDDTALELSSITSGIITVTGPGGYSAPGQLLSGSLTPSTGNPNSAQAVFSVPAPGGFFSKADNGIYTILLNGGHLSDLAGNIAASATLSSFTIALPAPPSAPDLRGSIPSVPKTVQPQSSKNSITLHLTNTGSKAFKGTLPIKLYASSSPSFDPDSAVLLANTSAKVNLAAAKGSENISLNFAAPASITDGSYHIIAVLDPANKITEQFKSNNIMVASGSTHFIAPVVDLSATLVGSIPSRVTKKKKATVEVRITNLGTVAAKGPAMLSVFASSDQVLNTSIDTLLVKQTSTISLLPKASKTFILTLSDPSQLANVSDFMLAQIAFLGKQGDSNLRNDLAFSKSKIAFMS